MAFYLGSYLTDILDKKIITSQNLNIENLYLCGQLSYFNNETSIVGSYAFYDYSALTSVNLPQATSIGSYAFNYCSALTSISLPQVTTIENNAFYYCDVLTSINLPQVITIGDDAFYHCVALTSINFSQATSIGSSAFAYCSALTSINFSQVTSIGSSAFAYCDVLTSVNLPQATSIGSGAFASCGVLSSIDLPQVISIGSRTFYSCESLINVNCPKLLSIAGGCSLTMTGSIGNPIRYGAFAYCRSLQTISVPLVSFIEPTAFAYCSYLTSFIGPEVLTVGGRYLTSSARSGSRTYTATFRAGAFEGCRRLSIVSLPKVSQISTYAFVSCYNLLSLYLLGSSIPTLSSTAFYSTPISTYTTSTGGIYGSIYVPASLYNSYLTATGWSVYSARIVSV